MFNTIEQTSRLDLARKFAMFLISTLAHAAAILILVLLPLIFIGAIPEVDLLTFLIAAPAPPPAPIPPAPPVQKQARLAPKPVIYDGSLPPRTIPKGLVPTPPEPEPGEVAFGPTNGLAGSPLGTVPGGIAGSPLGDAFNSISAPPPLPSPPPPPKQRTAVRQGGVVQQSKLIRKIEPAYPQIAIRARVSGTVILDVRIDEEGNVENIRVLQGHPLLIDAAKEAVMQWKYSPTILNGEPVPVVAMVTVIFSLH